MAEPEQPIDGQVGSLREAVRGACRDRSPESALTCLLATTQELNASSDLEAGLRRVAERLKEFVDYDSLGVLLLDDRGKELHFALAVGFPEEVRDHWRFGMGQGIVGIAAATRSAVRVDDVRDDPRYINANRTMRSELAIPLVFKDRTVGVIDVGSTRPGHFAAEDQRLLGYLGDHLAGAVENARLYQNMRQQARTLSLLHEVSRDLTSILDRRQLLARVAELVQRLIDYDVFTLVLWNEASQSLETSLCLRRDGTAIDRPGGVPLGYGICGTAAALRQPLRVPNVDIDPRYEACDHDLPVRSELAVPLVLKERLIGVLDLESVEYDAFRARDEQLLSTLASSLAIALENARLYEMLREDEERLQRDLTAARELQKQLLPKTTPWLSGLQVAVAAEPARHLGGDFYDFLPYGEGERLAIAVGDVAGKGTSAALYGSLAIGTLREFANQDSPDPRQTLADMNDKLGTLAIKNRFVAMTFAVYDRVERTLTLANSGLPYPYLVRRGEIRQIEIPGVPLGLLPDRTYRQVELALEPGDTLVIASDGIEECRNDEGEEFGSSRVEETLRRLADRSADEIAHGLLKAVQRFAGTPEPSDDRTILALKATEE